MHDDLRVTSELYRLTPPRSGQRSELQEALDAARGTGGSVADPAPTDDDERPPLRLRFTLPRVVRSASRRALIWLGSLITLTLAGVLSLAIYSYLTRH